mgnify:CR=1 FL=1
MEWSEPSRSVSVGVARADGRVTIRVAGELDIASVPALARELHRAVERPVGRTSLDLSRVTFCGTAGVDLLLDARMRAAAAGGSLAVERAHSAVLRPLRSCGDVEGLRIAHTYTREAPPGWTGWRGRIYAAMLADAAELQVVAVAATGAKLMIAPNCAPPVIAAALEGMRIARAEPWRREHAVAMAPAAFRGVRRPRGEALVPRGLRASAGLARVPAGVQRTLEAELLW